MYISKITHFSTKYVQAKNMYEQICLFLKCVNFSEKFVHAKKVHIYKICTFLVNKHTNIKINYASQI